MSRLSIFAVLLLLGACAGPPPAQSARQFSGQCFWPSEVSGFSDAGPDGALVRIGQREMWELTLSPGCPDVNWALSIGIRARAGERICSGRPAELVVPEVSGSGGRRCLVRSVRKLSPEEAAAARGERPRR